VLKRIFRLTEDKDFQNVYRRGRYNATALFSVNVLPNRFGMTKIGIVVNKKVTKKASERNFLKRQVREIVRLALPKIQKGQSIVVTVRQPALKADYKTMEKDILASFKRLGVLTDENSSKIT
jgi:ribonuclease P protein component